jgi:predicted transcriptional regulator
MAAVAQGLIVVMSPSKLSGVAQPVIARMENGKFPALNSVYRPLQEADARVCNGFYE